MPHDVYKRLWQVMAQRGGPYPGMDIPEFYELAQELFTLAEAEVAVAMPRKPAPASIIAQQMGKKEEEVRIILEAMADKGLCSTFLAEDQRYYVPSPFVPGIFEFQFMRGTKTERDRKIAKLIHAYKKAVDRLTPAQPISFPYNRVIPIGVTIRPDSRLHTFNQVFSYIDRYDPIAVSTCFCRHEAKLLNEKDDCGKPDDVCMQFGRGAAYVIERGLGKEVSKEEAKAVLQKAEKAGLVHASLNTQEIDFICNCCPCHCLILKRALSQPQPGKVLYSGYQPIYQQELCTGCGTCAARCPAHAVNLQDDIPQLDPDRCLGCGICASSCPVEAITMELKPDTPPPPLTRKELRQALEMSRKN